MKNTPTKTLSILSSILTVILVILISVVLSFMQLVALNGFSESEGLPAIITSIVCQTVSLILSAVFAGWLTRRLAEKSDWNKILIVILATLGGTLLGSVLGILSFIISLMVAQTLWSS